MRQLADTPEESGFLAAVIQAEAIQEVVGPAPAGIRLPRLAGLLSATTDIFTGKSGELATKGTKGKRGQTFSPFCAFCG